MSPRQILVLPALAILGLPSIAQVQVDPSDPANLQAAIDSAASNSTLLIEPGIYDRIFIDKPLKLIGLPTFTLDGGENEPFSFPDSGPFLDANISAEFQSPLVLQGVRTAPDCFNRDNGAGASGLASIRIQYPTGQVWVIDGQLEAPGVVGCADSSAGGQSCMTSTAQVSYFLNCSLTGADSWNNGYPCSAFPAGSALSASSTVIAVDSVFRAGDSSSFGTPYGFCPGGCNFDTTLDAAETATGVTCASLYAWNSAFIGGKGAPYVCDPGGGAPIEQGSEPDGLPFKAAQVTMPEFGMSTISRPSLGSVIELVFSEQINGIGLLAISLELALQPTSPGLEWLFVNPVGPTLVFPLLAAGGSAGVFVPNDPSLIGLPVTLQCKFQSSPGLSSPIAFVLEP